MIPSLPFLIQQSVLKVLNVEADGHCGFRAVAWALGRGQGNYMRIREEMIAELKERRQWYIDNNFFHNINSVVDRLTATPGYVGRSKWMSFPTMGNLIANAFKTPVFFFSKCWSQTFFPYFAAPNNNPPIFLALVENHFFPLVLQTTVLFPAPQLLCKDWAPKATPNALQWDKRFAMCFECTVGMKLLNPSSHYYTRKKK